MKHYPGLVLCKMLSKDVSECFRKGFTNGPWEFIRTHEFGSKGSYKRKGKEDSHTGHGCDTNGWQWCRHHVRRIHERRTPSLISQPKMIRWYYSISKRGVPSSFELWHRFGPSRPYKPLRPQARGLQGVSSYECRHIFGFSSHGCIQIVTYMLPLQVQADSMQLYATWFIWAITINRIVQ